MFTGIVEEVGTLLSIETAGAGVRLKIGCEKVLEDVKLGDSIATNGVCLTVSSFGAGYFVADVMRQTISLTGFSGFSRGSHVNLERALRLSDRLGGHLVAGHVDGIGRVVFVKSGENDTRVTVEAEDKEMVYIIPQGSVAIDGMSLTVADVEAPNLFTVSIIPTTMRETIIAEYRVGTVVNLETDMVGRYLHHFMQKPASTGVSMELLAKNGFL